MPHGEITQALCETAATAGVTSFFDPTGGSQITFVVAGTGAIIGITYHGTKKVVSYGIHLVKKHRKGDVPMNPHDSTGVDDSRLAVLLYVAMVFALEKK
ncbi:hypothetical protein LTR66_003734 [Elasticomyces elasticus]|nr:hypothetical protein LTR50_004753 [Elasticomyces elasticus]KAK4996707.1 hypothetical protein LTR66_003734 [Elasticomyces elasticus]